ncbi:hypothetical protein EDD86DRAFT_14298 [Gorgonomyces haynaldii]|nr:hypothetical protein EDD86DRAFT_14298 [Gorgonomyces haynaldii]
MEQLPVELQLKLLQLLPLDALWKCRRLSRKWLSLSERAFGAWLYDTKRNQQPLLLLQMYLLNGRGGPWFSQLGADAVEDCRFVPVFVESVDFQEKQVVLAVQPSTHISLSRRAALDPMHWCCKGSFGWFSIPRQVTWIPKSMFTLISPETKMLGTNNLTITTFDMQCKFRTQESNLTQHVTETQVHLDHLVVSWSAIFNAYCIACGITRPPYLYSVHGAHKTRQLELRCLEHKLDFRKYWTVDVVLHWLTHGEPEDLDAVISFLQAMELANTNTKQKRRFYTCPT